MSRELLLRCKRELLDVLASCNREVIHHDGDEFHELLTDIESALAKPVSEPERKPCPYCKGFIETHAENMCNGCRAKNPEVNMHDVMQGALMRGSKIVSKQKDRKPMTNDKTMSLEEYQEMPDADFIGITTDGEKFHALWISEGTVNWSEPVKPLFKAHAMVVLYSIDSVARIVDMRNTAELDEYRKDAERYRWLRYGDNDDKCIEYIKGYKSGTAYLIRAEKLDAAIDAAMKDTP